MKKLSHEQLQKNYRTKVENRRVLDNGSVKYDIEIICEQEDKTIIQTTYTVSKRQEEGLESILENFTKKKAREYEHDKGKDHSGKEIKI